jgi:hypothetical protein
MAEEPKTKTPSRLARKEMEYEFFKQVTGMIIAAFSLVAALAWNEAVKGLIDRYVSADAGLRSKFYYAFIVTVLAVVITYSLGRMGEKFIRSKNQDKQD